MAPQLLDATVLAIETTNLQKRYGETRAVDGINLSVSRGSVYGLLGPNGAGKTTTIRMLTTLIRPDGGSARVLGHDLVTEADAVRAKVASPASSHRWMKTSPASRTWCCLRACWDSPGAVRANAATSCSPPSISPKPPSARCARTPAACDAGWTSPPASSSPASCCSWTSPPPASTRAAATRCGMWCAPIAAEGTTVLLTTQHMEEADRLADRMAVIDHGKVIAEGTGQGAQSLHRRPRPAHQTQRFRAARCRRHHPEIRARRSPWRQRARGTQRQGHA